MNDHPIRRSDVQDQVEKFTCESLGPYGGTGRILVEFDFKGWRPISYRPSMEGPRKDLTSRTNGVDSPQT